MEFSSWVKHTLKYITEFRNRNVLQINYIQYSFYTTSLAGLITNEHRLLCLYNRNQTVLPYLIEISCLPVVEPSSSQRVGGEFSIFLSLGCEYVILYNNAYFYHTVHLALLVSIWTNINFSCFSTLSYIIFSIIYFCMMLIIQSSTIYFDTHLYFTWRLQYGITTI